MTNATNVYKRFFDVDENGNGWLFNRRLDALVIAILQFYSTTKSLDGVKQTVVEINRLAFFWFEIEEWTNYSKKKWKRKIEKLIDNNYIKISPDGQQYIISDLQGIRYTYLPQDVLKELISTCDSNIHAIRIYFYLLDKVKYFKKYQFNFVMLKKAFGYSYQNKDINKKFKEAIELLASQQWITYKKVIVPMKNKNEEEFNNSYYLVKYVRYVSLFKSEEKMKRTDSFNEHSTEDEETMYDKDDNLTMGLTDEQLKDYWRWLEEKDAEKAEKEYREEDDLIMGLTLEEFEAYWRDAAEEHGGC